LPTFGRQQSRNHQESRTDAEASLDGILTFFSFSIGTEPAERIISRIQSIKSAAGSFISLHTTESEYSFTAENSACNPLKSETKIPEEP
jgi:hypothetical protein